jgi:hypothetical protein
MKLAARRGRIVPLGAGRGIFLSGMILSAGVGLICFSSFRNLAFKRTYVENTRDRKSFTTRELPGFVYQRKDSEALIYFRQTIAPGFHLNEEMNALAKVIAVRKWVRDLQSDKSEDWQGVYTEDSERSQGSARRAAERPKECLPAIFLYPHWCAAQYRDAGQACLRL